MADQPPPTSADTPAPAPSLGADAGLAPPVIGVGAENPVSGATSPGGRFIEHLSPEGSRTSADAQQAPPADQQQGAAPSEPTAATTPAKPKRSLSFASRPSRSKSGRRLFRFGRNKASVKATGPPAAKPEEKQNEQQPPSQAGAANHRRSKDEVNHVEKHDRAEEEREGETALSSSSLEEPHPWLSAVYPLSHFIGYRPLSHPHTPASWRFSRFDPRFNRFHHVVGVILSFGLPRFGRTGNVAKYRESGVGPIRTGRMYTEQVFAKVVDAIHSTVAAWTLIVWLAFLSRSAFFRAHSSPLVIAAFGAEAVVTFVTYQTAFAQPKNVLFGNAISAVVTVALIKAFNRTNFTIDNIYGTWWAAVSTPLAAAVLAMVFIGVTHPPGGAIAVLAMTSAPVYQMDWYLVPVVIISSLVTIGWALIINNLGGRSYPNNWFYAGAFANPPILGPEEQQPFESPYLPTNRGRLEVSSDPEKGLPPSCTGALSSGETTAVPHSATKGQGQGQGQRKRLSSVKSRPSISSPIPIVEEASTEAEAEAEAGVEAKTEPGPEPKVSTDQRMSHPGTWIDVTPAAAAIPWRLQEEEGQLSRRTSKGSKKSRRSIQVHVNEPRGSTSSRGRLSVGSAPPVPAVQWR